MKLSNMAIAATVAIGGILHTGTATAALVGWSFSATVSGLFTYDGATKEIVHVSSSDFPGSQVSIGDHVSGSFVFDTNTPLSPYYQPPTESAGSYLAYVDENPGRGLQFTFDGKNLAFNARPFTLLQIRNDAASASGWDTFDLSSSSIFSSTSLFQVAGISLMDSTGAALNGPGLPTDLQLKSYFFHEFTTGWVRSSDGNQLQVQATLTDLTPLATPVPEPSAFALLLLGLGAVTGFAQARRVHSRPSKG